MKADTYIKYYTQPTELHVIWKAGKWVFDRDLVLICNISISRFLVVVSNELMIPRL